MKIDIRDRFGRMVYDYDAGKVRVEPKPAADKARAKDRPDDKGPAR